MYSLIVANSLPALGRGTIEMERGRFLEYTSNVVADILQSLSIEAQECLCSWPCILMREGRDLSPAFVGYVSTVELLGSTIRASFATVQILPPITNEVLWKAREDLDIEQFEFSRNHWAIKKKDLFSVLASHGRSLLSAGSTPPAEKPLPQLSRARILSARDPIAQWSHTAIDDFLLEAGVTTLRAGRDVGSKRDRAIAIVKFAIENPSATTADGFLFSLFLIRKALATSDSDSSHFGSTTDFASGEPASVAGADAEVAPARAPNRVFVVHGHNEAARKSVVDVLSGVGLEAVVLHEQPNMGRHLLTKLVEEAELVAFAVVIMTDDDIGGTDDNDLRPRARQNVILELGYFLSHLGQRRVCAVMTPGLETPSDFDGIVYLPMDAAGRWKATLCRELRAAQMPIKEQ